jgi:hypothetical protein
LKNLIWESTITTARVKASVTVSSTVSSTVRSVLSGSSTKVNSQCTTINLLAEESLLALDGTLSVDKISVCETSWLTGTSVNGNSDINDISDITEELVQVGVGHLESKVADEESFGWRVLLSPLTSLGLVVDNNTATF